MNCGFCPQGQIEYDLSIRCFFMINCYECGTLYFSRGDGHLSSQWDAENKVLLPSKSRVVALPEADLEAYKRALYQKHKTGD